MKKILSLSLLILLSGCSATREYRVALKYINSTQDQPITINANQVSAAEQAKEKKCEQFAISKSFNRESCSIEEYSFVRHSNANTSIKIVTKEQNENGITLNKHWEFIFLDDETKGNAPWMITAEVSGKRVYSWNVIYHKMPSGF